MKRSLRPLTLVATIFLALGCGTEATTSNQAKSMGIKLQEEMTVNEALEKGKIDNVEALKQREVADLFEASKSGYFYRAYELIKDGADVNAKDKKGWTPLHLSVCAWSTVGGLKPDDARFSIIDVLLKNGADVNATLPTNNYTPLYVAADMSQTELAMFLIEKGADVNAKVSGDMTPLHQVLGSTEPKLNERKIALVKALVNKGADINVLTKRGDTPLDFIINKPQNRDVANFLISNGAKTSKELNAKR